MARLSGKRKEGLVDIDLNSLTDISFLLLMFFILATTFIKPAGEQLNIPSGAPGESGESDKSYTINLSANEIRIGSSEGSGDVVTIEVLRDKLLAEKFPEKPEGKRIVILDSKPDVGFQSYFEVVSAIAQSGGVLALLESKGGGGE